MIPSLWGLIEVCASLVVLPRFVWIEVAPPPKEGARPKPTLAGYHWPACSAFKSSGSNSIMSLSSPGTPAIAIDAADQHLTIMIDFRRRKST